MAGQVIVGPLRLRDVGKVQSGKTVPEILEFGGMSKRKGSQSRLIRYAARPFMGPASKRLLIKTTFATSFLTPSEIAK